jgi:hypothetical protein
LQFNTRVLGNWKLPYFSNIPIFKRKINILRPSHDTKIIYLAPVANRFGNFNQRLLQHSIRQLSQVGRSSHQELSSTGKKNNISNSSSIIICIANVSFIHYKLVGMDGGLYGFSKTFDANYLIFMQNFIILTLQIVSFSLPRTHFNIF